jgi:hypothetical protein
VSTSLLLNLRDRQKEEISFTQSLPYRRAKELSFSIIEEVVLIGATKLPLMISRQIKRSWTRRFLLQTWHLNGQLLIDMVGNRIESKKSTAAIGTYRWSWRKDCEFNLS